MGTKQSSEFFVAFIDLEKANGRVNSYRVKLWEAPRQAQVGEGLVQSLYMECEVRVKVGEKYFGVFKVDQDVRQGCTLLQL